MTSTAEHTPTPWWYQEKSDSYTHILRSGENRFVCQFGSEATARRVKACVNAFHSPDGRSIATENIPEGLAWQMHDALKQIIDDLPSNKDWLDPALEAYARGLIAYFRREPDTLKIEQSDAG